MACSKGVTVATAHTRMRGGCSGSLLRTCTARPKTWMNSTTASTERLRCRVSRFSMAVSTTSSLSQHPLGAGCELSAHKGGGDACPSPELFNRNLAQQLEVAEHF